MPLTHTKPDLIYAPFINGQVARKQITKAKIKRLYLQHFEWNYKNVIMKQNLFQFHKVVFLDKSLTHFVYEKHEKWDEFQKNYETGLQLIFKSRTLKQRKNVGR